jgi:hypothetical protein
VLGSKQDVFARRSASGGGGLRPWVLTRWHSEAREFAGGLAALIAHVTASQRSPLPGRHMDVAPVIEEATLPLAKSSESISTPVFAADAMIDEKKAIRIIPLLCF